VGVARTHLERETKFDVTEDFGPPEIADLAGEAGRTEQVTVDLASTYFDTSDFALLARRVTLRRREGDIDTGWQLKVPAGAARTEIQLPLEAGADVPPHLSELVAGLTLGQPLNPIALVNTQRHLTYLYEGDQLLAEIADDHVHGTAFGEAARVTLWREVEVELAGGDEQLLAKVGKRLVKAGACPSKASSKLARTLDRDAAPDRSTAPGLLMAYLSDQLTAISAGDVALRRGLDPVHKTRVAVRRFRSVLRVFASVLDRPAAEWLDGELSWYQDLLGEVRDRQVQRARFAETLATVPVELVLGPVAARIEKTLLSEQLICREQVAVALDSDRYRSMLAAAGSWANDPPVRRKVQLSDLLRIEDKARRRAVKRLKRALAVDDPVLLHKARKAAKRARYATELTAPAMGKSAKKAIKRYKHVQDVLGEHQDGIVAADILRRLGAAAAAAPGQNGFTFGLMYERELAGAARARAKARHLKL
jgi:CHAD domain-containing protein